MLPGTGPIPAATLLTAIRQFTDPGAGGSAPPPIGGRERRQIDEEAIDVDYRDVD